MGIRILAILFSLLFIIGCPAPWYQLKLKTDGKWQRKVEIGEDHKRIIVTGRNQPLRNRDFFLIEFIFEGFSKNELKELGDKITYKTNIRQGIGNITPEITRGKFNLEFMFIHEDFIYMSREQFSSYLDSTYFEIFLASVFSETRAVEVKMDKEKMFQVYNEKLKENIIRIENE